MLKRGKPQDTLPGADPQLDCQTPEDEPSSIVIDDEEGDRDDDHEHALSWRDIVASEEGQLSDWLPHRARWTILLERVALAVERPANRLIGSAQLNPFYHTGTIATLLLIIVALTGFFLFLFFQYGFDASYHAVLTRIETPIIARTIRAVHRYASGALVITTLLHAYRTLFMERFRGPRWLAWVTGILMTVLLWGAGVTGYWLIWDQRAQLINDAFVDFLGVVSPLAASYMVTINEAAMSGTSWPIFLAILAVHIVLFLVVAGFYWYHIKRLKRPKWLPPAFWVIGIGVVVVLLSLLFPAGMLPQGDLTQLPQKVTIDPLFLFYLPAREHPLLNVLIWGGLLLGAAFLTVLPWFPKRDHKPLADEGNEQSGESPTVQIIKERCSGCTVCALDCPYGAITMVERTDGKRHKYIAIETPDRCVSCGICIGSCDGVAVTMGNIPPVALWETIAGQLALAKLRSPLDKIQVVFTCERHAVQGGRAYINGHSSSSEGNHVEVVTLPCVGAAPPDLLSRTINEGVANVHIIGCPLDDCTNREGNIWLEQRITRERVPRLKRQYADSPITASWLPPDDFDRGIAAIPPASNNSEEVSVIPDYASMRQITRDLTWRNYAAAFVLLALVLLLQILATDLPFSPYQDVSALGRVVIADIAEPIGRSSFISTTLGPELRLHFEIDGEIVLEDSLPTSSVLGRDKYPYFFETELLAGKQHLRLALIDPQSSTTFVFFDDTISVEEDEILTLPQGPD